MDRGFVQLARTVGELRYLAGPVDGNSAQLLMGQQRQPVDIGEAQEASATSASA